MVFNFIQNIRKSIPLFSTFNVVFDLGTHTTKIGIEDKGVILREPTCIALRKQPHEYLFFGTEAKSILGKTPDFLHIIRPIVHGIISDFDSEVALLQHFIRKAILPYTKSYLIKPPFKAVAALPTIATEIEQKAVEESILKAGFSYIDLVKKPLATTAGAGFDIFSHTPHLIVDLGAGITEISIVSGGGIVLNKSIKQAGEYMDKVIGNYIHLKHGITLGEATCERLKTDCVTFTKDDRTELVRGKSLENGLPKSVKIRSSELREALTPTINIIVDGIKELLELAPPEIVDDVFKEGVIMTGKMVQMPGLTQLISEEIDMEVVVPDQAVDATVYGMLSLLKKPQLLKTIRISTA